MRNDVKILGGLTHYEPENARATINFRVQTALFVALCLTMHPGITPDVESRRGLNWNFVVKKFQPFWICTKEVWKN